MPSINDYQAPTTELQAVNVVLEACGQRPVGSLDSPGEHAATAIKRLGESNVETQAEGWAFNTDDCFEIDPTTAGEIVLPANTLLVRQITAKLPVPALSGGSTPPTGPALVMVPGTLRSRVVIRGGKLYDRKLHTFNIGVPVQVDLTVCLPFEDVPQNARWYITLKAARRMAAGKLVSGTVYQFTKADEDQARIRMEQEEDVAQWQDQLEDNPHIAFMRQK